MGQSRPERRRRTPRDPLQVNLRWVVYLILLLVIVPTVLLTGLGIFVLWSNRGGGLLMGLLVTSFSASVVAGATLLLALARRGARLAQIQETFLSRMSHELLTPLAGIRLHSQILSGMPLGGDARDSVEAIAHEARRLEELVDRIVAWRRFRSRRLLYHRRTVRLGSVVAETLRRIPNAASIKVRVFDPLVAVNGDPDALAEALGNLLLNAQKYAGQEGIELTSRRIGRMATLTVSDRGPGLPPGPPEQIFEPFFRFVPPDRPDPGGSGLGLSITRQIVRAHGGKLAVVQRRGPGLHFCIVLPLASGS